MSIHEIKYSEGHHHIHLPHCGKSYAWRIRRFIRQLKIELKILLHPPECMCQNAISERTGTRPRPRAIDYLNEHNFPTDEYWNQLT